MSDKAKLQQKRYRVLRHPCRPKHLYEEHAEVDAALWVPLAEQRIGRLSLYPASGLHKKNIVPAGAQELKATRWISEYSTAVQRPSHAILNRYLS